MAGKEELIDELSDLALFADLARPELAGVAHTLEEEWYADGQRILREGFSGTGFYILLEGEVAVRIEGQERARRPRGRTGLARVPHAPPERHVPHAPGADATAAEREPMGEVDARPFPPGDYPLVVVGRGPGGIQGSYSLRRLGVDT